MSRQPLFDIRFWLRLLSTVPLLAVFHLQMQSLTHVAATVTIAAVILVLILLRARPVSACAVGGVVVPLAVLAILWSLRGVWTTRWIDIALALGPYIVIPAAVAGTIAVGAAVIGGAGVFGRVLYPVLLVGVAVALAWPEEGFRYSLLSHPTLYMVAAALTAFAAFLAQRSGPTQEVGVGAYGAGPDDDPAGAGRANGDKERVPAPFASDRPTRRRRAVLILLPLVLALVGPFLVLSAIRRETADERGGLMAPTLFRFDFTDYLSLSSEIRLSRDLVLLYHESNPPRDRLLRRYILSGYDTDRGFFRAENGYEQLPLTRPSYVWRRESAVPPEGRSPVEQRYYLVNFDAQAALAVNEPTRIVPYQRWENASFNAVYRADSMALTVGAEELRELGRPDMPSEQFLSWYTRRGDNELIRALAEEASAGADTYYDTAKAIERYLRDEYYYSLSPGVATDGDQLSHFLSESRKGYCSYFAFSMALMLRSLDIPARVAVGFFIEPESRIMNYYPVRADMAHAWVEVYFGPYGWVEFDPTSQTLAPGEPFEVDAGVDQEQLASLVEEIVRNSEELKPVEEELPMVSPFRRFLKDVSETTRRWWPVFLAAIYGLLLMGTWLPVWLWRRRARRSEQKDRRYRASSRRTGSSARHAIAGLSERKGGYRIGKPRRKGVRAAVLSEMNLLARELRRFGLNRPEGMDWAAFLQDVCAPDAAAEAAPEAGAGANSVVAGKVGDVARGTAGPPALPANVVPAHESAKTVAAEFNRAAFGPEDSEPDWAAFSLAVRQVRGAVTGVGMFSRVRWILMNRLLPFRTWRRGKHRTGHYPAGTHAAAGPPAGKRRAGKPPAAGPPAGKRRAGKHPAAKQGTQVLFLIFAATLLLFGEPESRAQTQQDTTPTEEAAAQMEEDIWDAIDAENYDRAVRLLEQARRTFAEDHRFPLIAGDLYSGRQLYSLAENAYRDALKLGAPLRRTSLDLAQAVARQNREQEAIGILERLASVGEPDPDTAGDLAWLYYKTHRLQEARSILEEALDSHGPDRYLSMTLATVYAALWDLESSQEYYRKAIESADEEKDALFSSVAYYNLSIVQSVFYRFGPAFESSNRAIELVDRSSGYLIRGELYEQQLLFEPALRDYERAQSLDTQTPLPQLSQAMLLYRAGHLTRARSLIEWVLQDEDPTWLYNYGTDLDRFQLDLYTSAADIYLASARQAWRAPRLVADTTIGGWWRALKFRVKAWYHRGISRRLAVKVAESYRREDRELNALWTYLTAFEDMERITERYLVEGRQMEREVIPESELDYDALQAINAGEPRLLARVAERLDSKWYAHQRSEVLTELLRTAGPVGTVARDLFHLNRGAFLRSGLSVPVEIQNESSMDVAKALRRRGMRPSEHPAVRVRVQSVGGEVRWTVYDAVTNGEIQSGTVGSLVEPGGVAELATAVAGAVTRYPVAVGTPPPERSE